MSGNDKENRHDIHTGFPLIIERKPPRPLEWLLVYVVGTASAVTAEHWSDIVGWCCRESPIVVGMTTAMASWGAGEWDLIAHFVRIASRS